MQSGCSADSCTLPADVTSPRCATPRQSPAQRTRRTTLKHSATHDAMAATAESEPTSMLVGAWWSEL